MFGGSAYLFAQIKYFVFAFFPFIPFATQLFSTPVMSSNLCNQAPLFTELLLLQGIHFLNTVECRLIKTDTTECFTLVLQIEQQGCNRHFLNTTVR